MIKIRKDINDQIIDRAKKELPNEACGYLAGKDGVILKAFQMVNTDNSPEHFSFDPSEQFKIMREVRKEGLSVMAIYHSHPSSPARPSEEDIRLAIDPAISYLIVSLSEKVPVVKSFRIRENKVDTEAITEIN
jgi:[CysO sulfur-carrier protein]-S-L-cysteine hydrolase